MDNKLAPHTTIHGVLVDIYGIGVLIKGESSIGKSETALELIQRGNRLVADDAVEIRKLDESMLVGQSPELIRHFLEIRGIGIIDVRSLYGVGAIKNSKMIDLVVHLEAWDETKYYDRLGLDKEYEEILGVNVEKLVVPVKPGRNTAMILEVAAMNFRQRGMGYDAAQEFTKKLSKLIDTK
nr:HPr(Ser) kinase/phosphatase [Clostridioides difficile]